ncbi:MAG: HAMP domain-containing sensor histidine kinase, partial [Coriobacteriia bacterium]|nr:HAMP domain-containing sensor histidine kinase [Coriobacteriia bacterium]
YVQERVQSDAQALAELTARAYALDHGWSQQSLVELGVYGARRGMRVQIINDADVVLIDSAELGLSSAMPGMPNVSGLGDSPWGQNPSSPLREPVVRVPVYVDDQAVGAVRVASISPGSFLTDQDVQFRSASQGGLLVAALLAVALATAGGIAYSGRFSRPIERVTKAAASLRAGKRDARTGMRGDDPVGVLGRTLDEMADAIEAEREFERRLTADVAHELRTPLQAIQATVEAMQDGVLDADAEHLGVVRDETVRLSRLADSILDLSRLENRTAPLKTVPLDLSVPVMRSVETHRALMESLDLTLRESIEEGGMVSGDTDRLTQAFGNLIANAAHYTPEGGIVTVSVCVGSTEAVVTVADTGIGVERQDVERAFGRFWRSDAARERKRTGFGIGLSVVREIVEQHGGRVSLEPNTDGPGTTATVRLPLMERKGRTAV